MIISFSGPSGIGKGYIKERLLQVYPRIEELTWFTTRPLRPHEPQGHRIHVSRSEFNALADAEMLVLVQDLYGHRYGLRKEALLPSPRITLTEFHPENVRMALEINPAILAIGFITYDLSLLRERLSVLRKTESPAEIEERVVKAEIDIKTILEQAPLFVSVIEVAKTSEALVFDQVLSVVTPYLTEEGGLSCRSIRTSAT